MSRFGFIGPSYSVRSSNTDAEKTVNYWLEQNQSAQAKSAYDLMRTPGLKQFAILPGMTNVRSVIYAVVASGSRCFTVGETVSQQTLFELLQDGTVISRGTLGANGSPASMAYNNANQLMIASSGQLFLFNLTTNLLSEIDTTTGIALQGPVNTIAFDDEYFVALLANSQKFQISALLDGSAWDPLDIAQVSVFPDNVLSMVVDHREIVFFGSKAAVTYYNTGNSLFPFEVNPSSFAERGTIATWPPVKLDNSVFWWGGDERGSIMGFRSQGYTPIRITNHALEAELQSYPTITDVESYSFQMSGHDIWRSRFPSANKTWDYDVSTGQWTEASSLINGVDRAHRSRCHAFAFGKHLVGDWNSGKIYEMSLAYYTDYDVPIKLTRISPPISAEEQSIFFPELILDVTVGLPQSPTLTDAYGQPRAPQAMLQWSDDGAQTWSNEHWKGMGKPGEYKTRVRWRRMGRTRKGRCYKLVISDPVGVRITDAYLRADPGFKVPTQRLPKELTKAQ